MNMLTREKSLFGTFDAEVEGGGEGSGEVSLIAKDKIQNLDTNTDTEMPNGTLSVNT